MCEHNEKEPKTCNYISWNKPKIGEVWTPDDNKKVTRKRKTSKKKTSKKTTKKSTKKPPKRRTLKNRKETS